MKLLLPLCLFLFLSATVLGSATDTAATKYKSEDQVFINTTFFIKQILSFTNNNLVISPYILGYKWFPSRHHGLRSSIGGNFSSKKDFTDSTSVRIQKSGSFDMRTGYEYRYSFGKFWTFFAGADVVGNYTPSYIRVNSSSDIVTTKTTAWSVGGGPVVGIQINIHKHISLFTETAFYYMYGQSKDKLTSATFPQLNTTGKPSITQTGQFLLPTSIYFVFRF